MIEKIEEEGELTAPAPPHHMKEKSWKNGKQP
jgi:hypothetical protein